MFEAEYQNLCDERPEWGSLAILPWDTEIFGFAVADYRPLDISDVFADRRAVSVAIADWAAAREVQLIGCSVGAADTRWRILLPQIGFTYVDSTLTYALAKLQTLRIARKHVPVRLATVADQPAVERICEIGFRAGRYHADALFPLTLANARYRRWLAREFESLGESNRIYVAGEIGAAIGFTHVRVNGDEAYITIGGADPAVQSSVLPFAVFIGTLEALRDAGVRRVQSKLSAANTPMMNLAAFSGARFSDPQLVFHWHAPNAPHLLELNARP